MNSPIVAREIMATDLVTFTPEMEVIDAIGLLLKHEISGAPVVDADGNLVGIFSEKTAMRALLDAAYEQMPTTQLFAFMDVNVRTISEETDLLSIAQIFRETPVRRLPVLREGRLVGQVSRRDVLRAAHELQAVAAPGRDTALLYLSSLMDRNEAPIS